MFLQLILQMQSLLAESSSSSSIFKKPSHILTFIKHALEPTFKKPEQPLKSVGRSPLRIIQDDEDEEDEDSLREGDSDDEDAPGLEGIARKDEMAATAVNLLLSVLEGNCSDCIY